MANLAQRVLIVPPFECAWLTGVSHELQGSRGVISFEVKGENDVTIILKPECGSRRWQHLSSSPRNAEARASSPVEPNYTLILGSHRNSCLKIEKDGELCHAASNVPGSKLSATSFTKFWVSYDVGEIAVGTGEPSLSTAACCRWKDANPIPDIRFVGLSAWDKHVGYRNVRVRPSMPLSSMLSPPTALSTSHQPPSLLDLCCRQLLQSLGPASICGMLTVADAIAPVIDSVRDCAVEAAARQLPAILREDPEGFEGLTVTSLGDVLQHQSLVCGEKELFDALVSWAGGSDAVVRGPRHEDDARRSHAPTRTLADVESLLPHVRFPLMPGAELDAVAADLLHTKSALLQELVAEARLGAIPMLGAASVRAERLVRELPPSEAAASVRFQRRSPHGCTELIYLYDGDHNGVCWHIGTRYGAQKWINPAVAGLLAVTASSPVARGTDPRALLSGAFLRNNFAGPRREAGGGGLVSWWAVDLGAEHALQCNYYTLRADGSTDFLRDWELQGSQDGAAWTSLRRHEGDRTFKLPGQYASWAVAGPAATAAYRHFRILQLAPNMEVAKPRHVCLSYIELYGNFYQRGEEEAVPPTPATPPHFSDRVNEAYSTNETEI